MVDFNFRFGRGSTLFRKKLRNLGQVIDDPALWGAIGTSAVEILKNNMIRKKTNPRTGQSWVNSSIMRAAIKFERGTLNKGLLIDTGTMLNSITRKVNKSSVSVFSTDDPIKVAAHSNSNNKHKVFGRNLGSVLPDRVFISTSPEIEEMAIEELENAVNKVVR